MYVIISVAKIQIIPILYFSWKKYSNYVRKIERKIRLEVYWSLYYNCYCESARRQKIHMEGELFFNTMRLEYDPLIRGFLNSPDSVKLIELILTNDDW